MTMKAIGIETIAGQIGEIADKTPSGRECCVSFTDNEIVLCVKDDFRHQATGVTFEIGTPRLVLTAVTNIINRMLFDLSPAQSSAIVASTLSNVISLPRKQRQFVHQH